MASQVMKGIALVLGFVMFVATLGVSSNLKQTFACTGAGGVSQMAVPLPSGGTAFLSTSSGIITSANATQPPAPPPASLQALYGTINYSVALNQGVTSLTIQITYPSIPAGATFYKYIGGQWVQVPSSNYVVQGNVLTLTIADNSQFDTDSTTGIVADPLTLMVSQQQPDFSFSLNPTSGSTSLGGSVQTTATISTVNNFTGTATISLANAPSGVSVSPTSVNITQNGQQVNLTISVGSSVAAGTYNITVRMVSGSITRDQPFTLTVSQQTGNFSSSYSWSILSGSGNLSSTTARNPSVTSNAEDVTNVIGYQTVTPAAAAKTQIPSSYKIFFVGDIAADASVLRDRIATENPNLVILLGDYIYGFTSKAQVDSWYNSLIPANFSGTIIAVPGNHDIYATVEGGTGSPGGVDRTSTTQPTTAADLQLYLFQKIGMTPSGNIVYKDANVAVLGIAGAAFGPSSGAPDTTDSTISATDMQPIVSSIQREFARYWSSIIKQDQSAEWKIVLSHYQMLGYSSGSAGRDRNDLRYYFLPYLIKQTTDPASAESFDLILSGHIHGNGRSVVFKDSATAPMYAVADSNYTSANYDNNGSVDFTNNKSHGIIQVINGNGGISGGGNPSFNYASYPLTAYNSAGDFTGRVWTNSTWGYSTITITNTDTSTTATIRTYNRDDTTGSWNLSDTFSIVKNRRFAGDMQNINVNTDATTTPFTPHTNIFDPHRRFGLAAFTPNPSNANVNAASSQNITISAWIYWNGIKDVNTWQSVNWTESTGPGATMDALASHQTIFWTGDPRVDALAWQNTPQQFGIVNTGTNAGKLGYLAEDQQGNNPSFTSLVSTTAIQTGQWTHVAVTVTDGGAAAQDTVRFYINGALDRTVTIDNAVGLPSTITAFRNQAGVSDPVQSPYHSTVGHDIIGSRWFNGYIANVAVFNRTLTDTEIQQLYNTPNTASVLSDSALIYRFYFPSGTNGGVGSSSTTLTQTTMKDNANYFSPFGASARWGKDVAGSAGSAVSLNPTWLYADSGTYPLFIAAIFTPLLQQMAEISRKISKILPGIQHAYAQQQQQNSFESACRLADVLPIIGAATIIIAAVFSLLPRRDGGEL